MDYEKKYKEALERAKKFKEHLLEINDEGYAHEIDCMFPELKESEDEKVRKALIDLIYKIYANTSYITCDEHERMLAWLEKQGEKLPVGFYYVNSEGKKFYSDTFKYGNVTLHVEKQGEKDSQVTLPPFTFDDILALQCCMETVKKVQEDKDLYEKLNDLHGRVYDAYQLEKQGQVKESSTLQHEDTHEDVSCKENSNSLTDVDERIRKELTDYIKKKFENSCSPTPSKNILANWISWLEKQGGQKHIEMKSAEESLGITSEEYNQIVDECIYGEQKPKENTKVYNSMDDLIADALIEEIEGSDLDDRDKYNRIYWVKSHRQKLTLSEEDERIRKDIIYFLSRNTFQFGEDIDKYKSWIAWLEKQGEQHSAIRWYDVSLIPQEMKELLVEWDSEDATWHEIAFYHADTKTFWNGTRQVENVTRWCYIVDLLEKQGNKPQGKSALEAINDEPIDNANKVEPKFHEGQWIISYNEKSTYQVIEVKRRLYVVRDNADNHEYHISIEQCEKSGRLWTIADAKAGDVLVANGAPFIYKRHDKHFVYFYCGVNLADEFMVANGNDIWNNNYKVYPATNEQRVLLFSNMLGLGYAWDEKKLELKKITNDNEL